MEGLACTGRGRRGRRDAKKRRLDYTHATRELLRAAATTETTDERRREREIERKMQTKEERFCFSSALGVAKMKRKSERPNERECERRKRVIETSRWGKRGEEGREGRRAGGGGDCGETDR